MARPAFTAQVAARTGAAEEILKTKALLDVYLAKGGKKKDLETIRDRGLEAQAFNLGQSTAGGAGKAATLDVLTAFVDAQREYVAIMAIVRAARHDLEEAGASADTLKAIDQILLNETAVIISTAATQEGKPVRKAAHSQSQEDVRAEISKDAAALVALDAAHAELAERKVSLDRMKKLFAAAEALRGKLSTRVAKKGAAKGVTTSEHAAVSAQRKRWGSAYGVLALAGEANSTIQGLLDAGAKP